MSGESNNALLQQAVARLETLTGQSVDLTGASDNRLLQFVVALLADLEPGDGSGGGGAIPGSSPTFISATQPTYDGSFVWYQPQGDGTFKLFIEDGEGEL